MPDPPRPHARRTLAPQPPPPGIYASKYEPELGAAICRRIAAGESIRSICRADPAMPTEKTVWNWARAHPEFAAMKAHALSVARARSLQARAQDQARGWMVPAGVRRRRAWNDGLDGYFLDHLVARRILNELLEGRTLTAVCREPWAPSIGTFYNWLKRYPVLVGWYRKCKRGACEILMEEAWEEAPWMGTEAASEREQRARMRTARRLAAQLSPKRYAEPEGEPGLVVELQAPDGARRVIYEEARPTDGPSSITAASQGVASATNARDAEFFGRSARRRPE